MIGPRLLAIAWLPLAASLLGCAGYQVGNQNLYAADVRTVAVPVFESTSFRRNLGERLTEAVVKQIELRTPFKVVDADHADTVLSGKILIANKNQTVETKGDEPRESEVNMQVQVRWMTQRGSVIRDQTLNVPQSTAVAVQSGFVVPEYGQSIATAHQQAIDRLARQIVGLMEIEWRGNHD